MLARLSPETEALEEVDVFELGVVGVVDGQRLRRTWRRGLHARGVR